MVLINDSIIRKINNKSTLEEILLQNLITVTESGAMASYSQIGRGNCIQADFEAVKAIRYSLNSMNIRGVIKIGEGERDKAPMLYNGEIVGNGTGPEIDIAVDPLEGTNFVALGLRNSLSVMAMTPKNGLFNGPDIYFNKIVIGPKILNYINKNNYKINIDAPISTNIEIISKALNKNLEDINIVILNRDRHKNIIQELRDLNVQISLIQDGDLWPGILTCLESSGIDAVFGLGGSGEAVLTASAIKCLGGYMTGKLVLPSIANKNPKKDVKLELETLKNRFDYISSDAYNIYKQLNINDLVLSKDIIFSASSVTGNSILQPIIKKNNEISIMSFVTCSSKKYKIISNNYVF